MWCVYTPCNKGYILTQNSCFSYKVNNYILNSNFSRTHLSLVSSEMTGLRCNLVFIFLTLHIGNLGNITSLSFPEIIPDLEDEIDNVYGTFPHGGKPVIKLDSKVNYYLYPNSISMKKFFRKNLFDLKARSTMQKVFFL